MDDPTGAPVSAFPTLPHYCGCCLNLDVTIFDSPTNPHLLDVYPWAIQAHCNVCQQTLFFCRFCHTTVFLSDTASLTRHDRKLDHSPLLASHNPPTPPTTPQDEYEPSFPCQNDETSSDTSEIVNAIQPCTQPDDHPAVPIPLLKLVQKSPAELHIILRGPRSPEPFDFLKYTLCPHYETPPTEDDRSKAEFFQLEHQRKGSGLMKMALNVFTAQCKSAPSEMTLSWILFALLMSIIFLEIKGSHQTAVCLLLSLLVDKLSPTHNIPVIIPKNARRANYHYVNTNKSATGKSSLLEEFNLNRPEPLSGQHAFYSLVTTIQFVHATGHVLEPSFVIDAKDSTIYQSSFLHSSTPRSWELLRTILLGMSYEDLPDPLDPASLPKVGSPVAGPVGYLLGVYHLIFWSDSFEAFGTKQNRGSVWVLFCSIATPSSGRNPLHNTFNSGKNTFLVAVGPSGKGISHEPVWARLLKDLNTLNDAENPITTYSRFHMKELRSVFPIFIVTQDTPERTESNGLASWKSNTNVLYGYASPIVSFQNQLPSCATCFLRRLHRKAPTPCPRCLDWNVPNPVTITYNGLNQVVSAARERASNGMFPNRTSLVSYLRAAGIGPTLATEIGDRLYSDPGARLETPSLWQYGHLVDVNDSIEVVMHLLFLGITRSLAKDTVYPFISSRKQWTSYVSRVNTVFKRAQHMNIYWLRPQPVGISGSFGGWVSENYLAYSRLSKYLGALTEGLPAVDEPYEDPACTAQEMTTAQLQRWLLVRGMRVTKPNGQPRARKTDYVRTVLSTGWRRRGDPPHVSVDHTAGMPLSLFENVLTTCHTMVSSVMGVRGIPTVEEQMEILRDTKIHLTYDHIFHTWSSDSLENYDLRRGIVGVSDNAIVITGQPPGHEQSINVDPNESDTEQDSLGESNDGLQDNPQEDDEGSLTDESGIDQESGFDIDTTITPDAPAVVAGAYRIPAVAKRNKINCLKLAHTLGRVGSYQYVSELGGKGEGAIQTLKPVVKKLGGIQRKDWATLVAKAWSSRRFSRTALAMVVEAMRENGPGGSETSSDKAFLDKASETFAGFLLEVLPTNDETTTQPDLDADGLESLVDVVCHGGDAQTKRMYYAYKSREKALLAIRGGSQPISAVMVRADEPGGSGYWFGVVYVDETGSHSLLRIVPGDLVVVRCGASFFPWRPFNDNAAETDAKANGLSYIDYCLLLPLAARRDLDGVLLSVFYLITYWWREMLADGTIGIYRP